MRKLRIENGPWKTMPPNYYIIVSILVIYEGYIVDY